MRTSTTLFSPNLLNMVIERAHTPIHMSLTTKFDCVFVLPRQIYDLKGCARKPPGCNNSPA